MLCFDVSRNGKKLAVAGLRQSGALSLILSWFGRGRDASTLAAETEGPIRDLHFSVSGIDSSDPAGDLDVAWVGDAKLKVGDEIHICIVSADNADAPGRAEASKPVSRTENDARLIECSFCGEMRQSEPKLIFAPGIAGPDVFICFRCIVLAERLLDESLPQLFHLARAQDQTCSFCLTEHTPESVAARGESMCCLCVDMLMKDVDPVDGIQ